MSQARKLRREQERRRIIEEARQVDGVFLSVDEHGRKWAVHPRWMALGIVLALLRSLDAPGGTP